MDKNILFGNAVMTLVLVKNDCNYMHLHSAGEDFDKSHRLTDHYVERLLWEIDELAEIAIEFGVSVPNFSVANKILENYSIESLESYDYPTLIERLSGKINMVKTALQNLRNAVENTSVQSRLDEWLRYWENELNYKLKQRSKPAVNLSASGVNFAGMFVNSGLDERVATNYQSNHI